MTGWLFDIYGAERGMTLWMITGEGERLQLSIPYKPSFFIGGPPHVLRRVKETLGRTKPPVSASLTERADFWSGGMKPVLRIFSEVFCFHSLVKRVSRTSGVELYTCDIPPEQLFLYESGLFPLAFCEFETQDGVIRRIRNLDDPWDRAYSLPPLSVMKLSVHTNGANPNYGARNCPLRVEMDGTEYLLENDELLDALENMLLRNDPDVILTEWGDSFIIPRLRQMAQAQRKLLSLNRDRRRDIVTRRGASYFSYGRIVYRAPAQNFFGRWHIDMENSFIASETGLDGLFELARLAKIPVQRFARTSPGTGISSMQLDMAVREGILIPWRKRMPEDFKSGLELLVTDKGGLVYFPKPGVYDTVMEVDFASMYPAIMVNHNISPETINCPCCGGEQAGSPDYEFRGQSLFYESTKQDSVNRDCDSVSRLTLDSCTLNDDVGARHAVPLHSDDSPSQLHYGETPESSARRIHNPHQASSNEPTVPETVNSPEPGGQSLFYESTKQDSVNRDSPRHALSNEPMVNLSHGCDGDSPESIPPLAGQKTAAVSGTVPAATGAFTVPEIGYHVCQKRRGLVPKVLEPILEKRRLYKEMAKQTNDEAAKATYKRRQTALKWVLVTCFGYLGYKNARFGRIEAHEAVTALGREKLLQAKEVAEQKGFRFMHAIVDSLWVQKAGMTESEQAELLKEISAVAGITIALEGNYRWIAFAPSKTAPGVAVANRYFGLFDTGEMKIRGLEVRRSDMPPIVKNMQAEMLQILSSAANAEEFRRKEPDILAILKRYLAQVRSGKVSAEDLVISRKMSKKPADYKTNTAMAAASKALDAAGVSPQPGERVDLIIVDSSARGQVTKAIPYTPGVEKVDTYDVEHYAELLVRAAETVLLRDIMGDDLCEVKNGKIQYH